MHVPLERRSTSRIGLSLLGTVVVPLGILMGVVGFFMLQFGHAFGDLFKSLLPF
jgi:hypothetical protein